MRNLNLRSRVPSRPAYVQPGIQTNSGTMRPAKAFNRQQAIYNEKAAQLSPRGIIVTPGFLRLEVLAPVGGTSTYNFTTLSTSGQSTSTERRLKLSDSFTITDYAFFIGNVAATAYASTPDQFAKQTMHTFPNPTIFTTKADELEAIYNGFLTLRIDSTTFLDSIPMRQFYRVGTSQQQAAAANVPQVQRDEWTSSLFGKNELLPSITLNGQANIEWTLTLPAPVDCSGVTGAQNINLILMLTGFLNQGAARLEPKKSHPNR